MTGMKKTVFLMALLSAFLIVKSQTSVYHPFPDSNANWNFVFVPAQCQFGWATEDYSIKISGDTVIGNHTYHKLNIPYVYFDNMGSCTQTNTVGYKGAIREDEVNRKVYFVNPMSSTEILLYDFNMQVGDTVQGYLETGLYDNKDVVISVDSVLVVDSYRKRWEINYSYGIYVIEGLGSTYGLIVPSPGQASDFNYFWLNCFQQNSQAMYPDTNANCQLITSIHPAYAISNQVNVFPNPSSGSFTVELARPNDFREILLSNIIGNIIFRKNINNQNKVIIENLPIGTYIITIIDNENRTTNRKIISSL
jgi:hypothetical protein